jgi:hypothetical protein
VERRRLRVPMQVDDTLEIADTSSFGGDMTIDANAFVYGQSFAMYDGITENIYIRNDGNASFNQKLRLARNIDCNGTIDGFGTFNMKESIRPPPRQPSVQDGDVLFRW